MRVSSASTVGPRWLKQSGIFLATDGSCLRDYNLIRDGVLLLALFSGGAGPLVLLLLLRFGWGGFS